MSDFKKIGFLLTIIFSISCSIAYSADTKLPSPPVGLEIKHETSPPQEPTTPSGDEGLLTGMTPGNYRIPSGWSLVRTQDFESGILGNNERFGSSASFTSSRSHSGKMSGGGEYNGDSDEVGWFLGTGSVGIGQFTELYVSWWDYSESQGRQNDETLIARIIKDNSDGSLCQEIIIDGYINTEEGNGWNTVNSKVIFQPQGSSSCGGITTNNWGPTVNLWQWGKWQQFELWYRPNTICGTEGCKNGFIRLYQNGRLLYGVENVNLNGSVDMRSSVSVSIGGWISKYTWLKWEDNTCADKVPYGYECRTSFGGQSCYLKDWTKPCPCPQQCPPNGYVPIYKRYFDNIIVLKK